MANKPLFRVPFVLLLLIMLANASYASMGDISICFPFFLLLALLMAGMIAQGRSPLVGFDISISKPPAEIKSTSYHFKSYTSGGFDTVAKFRDQLGGGNYLSRGLGWVVDRGAKAVGKTVSKATGGKHGTGLAKGVGWAATMADRGALYALTSHSKKMQTLAKGVGKITSTLTVGRVGKGVAETGIAGGGYQANIEREKMKKEAEVKSLREMLGYGSAKTVNLVAAKNRIAELEAKAKKGKLKGSETRELNKLRVLVATREEIRTKKRELADLRLKEIRGQKLSKDEQKRLVSLRTELGKLEAKFQKAPTKKELVTLRKKIREGEKKVGVYETLVRQTAEYRKQLADIGGVQGRLKMMAYAPVAAASFAYLGAKYPISTVLVKPAERRRVRGQIKKLEEKKKNQPSKFTKDDEKKLKSLREKYEKLTKRGMLVSVFNPERLSRTEVLKATLKGWFVSSTVGAGSSLLQNIPYRVARVRYERARFKPQLAARFATAMDRKKHIEQNLAMLKDPSLTPAQRSALMRDTAEHMKRMTKEMRGGVVTSLLKDKTSKVIFTPKEEKEIKGLMKDIEKLSKKGPSNELFSKIDQLQKKVGKVSETLFSPEVREKFDNVKKELGKLNSKFMEGKISGEEYKKKMKELDKTVSQLSKSTPGLLGEVIMGEYAKVKVDGNKEMIRKLRDGLEQEHKKKISDLEAQYKEGKIDKAKYESELKKIKEEHKEKSSQVEDRIKVLSPYRRLEDSFYRRTVDRYATPEHTRATWLGVERLFDLWGEKAEAAKGRYTPEALAIRGVGFAASGFQKTQQLRHIASQFENVIGPTMALLSQEEFKKQHFLRLLGKEQTEIEERRGKLKGMFGGEKSLYAKRAELQDECAKLTSELGNLKPNTKEYKEKQKLLQKKRDELENTNLLIRDAKKELAKAERNIDVITTHIFLQDALLAQRQMRAFKEGSDEVKREIDSKINKIEKELKKDYQEKENTENLMRTLEKEGKTNTKQYRALEERLNKINSSIQKKEDEKTLLHEATAKRYLDLEKALRETAERTEIKVGGDKILRDRDVVLSEMSMLKAGVLETPNPYALSLMKTLGVAGKDEIESYKNINNLQGEEKERVKSEYEKALRNAYAELKNRWEKLETINLAEWTRKRMEETGESLGGSETGMHRDLLELQAILTRMQGSKSDFGKYLERKEKATTSMLYLTNFTYGQVLDAGTMDKYVKLYNEMEEMRRSTPKLAKFELDEINMRLNAVQGEIEEAERAGWKQRVEKLREREKELLAEKSKVEESLKSTQGLSESEIEKREERLKRMERKLNRAALVMQAAKLLQREGERGGIMQPDTANRLEKLREEYPEDERKGRKFWEEARLWAGQMDRKVSENVLGKYEATAVQLRNEIKGISSEIAEIEKKLKEKGGKIDVEAAELKSQLSEKLEERREKQKELIEVCKDWRSFKNAYDSVYAPHGRSEKWMGPGSEEKIRQFIEEYADRDMRMRFGIHERSGGVASTIYEKLSKFSTEHGHALLLAATVAAPFAMPFGVGAAAALTLGSYGIYGAKTGIRKFGEWETTGYPGATGDEAVLRTMNKIIEWSSHLTGRGSGGPARRMDTVWQSQVYGTAYIWKGLRLDRYWEIKPDQQRLELPDVGLPWYIRMFKTPLEGPSTVASYWGKRLAIAAEWPGGWDDLRRVIAENPRVPPEVQKTIQYQMLQMYGSPLPLPYPKQVREMLGFEEVSRTFAFYEPAKDVIAVRSFAYDPAGLRYGLLSGSYRGARGYSIASEQSNKHLQRRIDAEIAYRSTTNYKHGG